MYKLLRYFLFLLPPETAHHLTLNLLKLSYHLNLTPLFFKKNNHRPSKVFGLSFNNPIGIAAGLDKNGDYIDALVALGVGFIEVGAITPKPQVGNQKPRLFRLKEDEAIINRMGFNNKGVDYLVQKLIQRKATCPIGVNLGKNKDTPLAQAKEDYIYCLKRVYRYCDFLTINISSPNTLDLRKLQTATYLESLLQSIKTTRDDCYAQQQRYVPLLVKIAPDLSDDDLSIILDAIKKTALDGVIATNTSNARHYTLTSPLANEPGGLSGKPIKMICSTILKKIKKHSPELTVISVGGITSAEEATHRFTQGAALIQLYTGLIYTGPKLLKTILEHLNSH